MLLSSFKPEIGNLQFVIKIKRRLGFGVATFTVKAVISAFPLKPVSGRNVDGL